MPEIQAGILCSMPFRPRMAFLLALFMFAACVADTNFQDDDERGAMQVDEEGEGCAASVEPNDGSVFRDEASPVIFIAVGFCPRVERALATGLRRSTIVELKLEPGSRRFRWDLAHGIDEFGIELELPTNLPDEDYRGTVGLQAPYNIVLPVHFVKLSTSLREIDLVFPVPGFVFGRSSHPWLQVLVRDEQARARGVREIRYILQVHINETLARTVRSPNGNRIYVSARPGINSVHLSVLNVLGEPVGVTADLSMHVSLTEASDTPPARSQQASDAAAMRRIATALSAGAGSNRSASNLNTHTPPRGIATERTSESAADQTTQGQVNAAEEWEWLLACPPLPARGSGSPSCHRHAHELQGRGRDGRPGGRAQECSGHGRCRGARLVGASAEEAEEEEEEERGRVCVCDGDWHGEDCEHAVMHETRFLPATDPARSPARCTQAQYRQQAVASWLRRLESNTMPASCDIGAVFMQEFSGTRGLGITWRWLRSLVAMASGFSSFFVGFVCLFSWGGPLFFWGLWLRLIHSDQCYAIASAHVTPHASHAIAYEVCDNICPKP
jgi:hypothetical protein